jgi:hypothetical protein
MVRRLLWEQEICEFDSHHPNLELIMKFNQCTLEKRSGFSTLKTVSWIPSKFAEIGKTIKLKDDNGNWVDGWNVIGLGTELEEDFLPDYHSEIKAHRRATGDSLKKACK